MVPWNGQCPSLSVGTLLWGLLRHLCLFKWSEDIVEGILRSAWVVQLQGWGKKGRSWGASQHGGREEGRLGKFTYTGLYHLMTLWRGVSFPFTDGKTKAKRKVNAELGLLPKSVRNENTLEGITFLGNYWVRSEGKILRNFHFPNSLYMVKLLLYRPLTLRKSRSYASTFP